MRKLSRILLWSFDRGTWQYDVIVGLILAFIFFTPRTLFNTERIDKRILAYGQPAALSTQPDGVEDKKAEQKKLEQIKRN
jgi:hypothetical protein